MFKERFYRAPMGAGRFASVRARVAESDLWIGWKPAAEAECGAAARAAEAVEVGRFAVEELHRVRGDIEGYAAERAGFLESLEPLADDPAAPPVVAAMLRAAIAAGVGPMAAVAGAVAEAVGRAVRDEFGFSETVVENGGDLWIDVRAPLSVAVYAGISSLSGTFAVTVAPELCPCGLACSSAKVGPSLSFGNADAALALCRDAAAADAWATALGNRVKLSSDLEPAVRGLVSRPGAEGGIDGRTVDSPADADALRRPLAALAVMADRFAAAGELRLAPIDADGLR